MPFADGTCPVADAPFSALLREMANQADLDPTTRMREEMEDMLRVYLMLSGVSEVEVSDDEIEALEADRGYYGGVCAGIKLAMADAMSEARKAKERGATL